MHRAFNIINCEWNAPSEVGNAILKQNRDALRKSLEPFITGDIVDGTKLTNHWFPTIKADVFISHSHIDEESAIRCAGWLKTQFGLEPFIDSCAWGHSNELLRIIDDDYCLNPGGETYSYAKRNASTTHVHMMLSSALSAMIDATECIFFLKTDNSISSSGSINRSQSPWLFFELGMMRIIRRKKLTRRERLIRNFAGESREVIKAAEFKVVYEVPLSELTPLSGDQLVDWRDRYKLKPDQWDNPLDLLYDDIAPLNG